MIASLGLWQNQANHTIGNHVFDYSITCQYKDKYVNCFRNNQSYLCYTFLIFFNILLCVNCFNFNSQTTKWFGEFSVEMNSNQYIYNIWSNPIGCLEIVYFKITARYLLLLSGEGSLSCLTCRDAWPLFLGFFRMTMQPI